MLPPIIITVAPAGLSARGALFDAKTSDGVPRTLVAGRTTPLLDACRALLREGERPKRRVIMRHEGSDIDAMRTTVGTAAKLHVIEPDYGAPTFTRSI
jgi:hypothetical protein